MLDYFISQTGKFIVTYRKILILTTITVPVLIFATVAFTSYAVISIEVVTPATVANKPGNEARTLSDTAATNQTRIFVNSNGTNTELGSSGTYIIPRNSKSLVTQAGTNIRTQSPIDIPWYGYATKRVELKIDRGADKLAYKSTLDDSCGTYSQKNDRILMYECKNTKSLTRYDTPLNKYWGVEPVATDLYFPNYSPVPYMGGIIGVSYHLANDQKTQGFITSVNGDGKLRYFQHPDQIELSDLNRTQIFTDQNDQANKRIVLVAPNGNIYTGTPSDNESDSFIDFREITPPEDYNAKLQQTLCDLQNTTAICYRGQSPNIGDSTEETAKINPEIITINLESNKLETKKVSDKSILHEFAATDNGQLYGLNHKRLINFRAHDNELRSHELSRNVDHIAANDTLYFIQDGGVFTIDTKSHDSHQLFYSFNILPHKLIVSGQSVIILGKSANNNTNTYAWKLNEEYTTDYGKRLIDILPTFPSSSAYGRVDLVGTTIYLDVAPDRSSTPASIQKKKQDTLEYLRTMNVDVDQLIIANF